MNTIKVENTDQFESLYKDSALTFIGIVPEEIDCYINWIKESTPLKKEDCYLISGKKMNEHYGLIGNNRYPDNLNILCVKLSDMENPHSMIMRRFELSARWFDDVVDNNSRNNE